MHSNCKDKPILLFRNRDRDRHRESTEWNSTILLPKTKNKQKRNKEEDGKLDYETKIRGTG